MLFKAECGTYFLSLLPRICSALPAANSAEASLSLPFRHDRALVSVPPSSLHPRPVRLKKTCSRSTGRVSVPDPHYVTPPGYGARRNQPVFRIQVLFSGSGSDIYQRIFLITLLFIYW